MSSSLQTEPQIRTDPARSGMVLRTLHQALISAGFDPPSSAYFSAITPNGEPFGRAE